MKNSVTYFAVFEKSADCYGVYFPDLPGCVSMGDTFEEASRNAQEALALHLWGLEEDQEPIPAPTVPPFADAVPGDIVAAVTVYPDLFRQQMNNRAVRVNVSIPAWLKNAADAAGLSCSQVLQAALADRLNGPA